MVVSGSPSAAAWLCSPHSSGERTRRCSGTASMAPGAELEIGNLTGPGILRHLRVATHDAVEVMRGLVIRAWWDGQSHPSIEAPLGDFFGFAHGHSPAYGSAVHTVNEGQLDFWLPMPFRNRARLTLANDLAVPIRVHYALDYSLGTAIPEDAGYLHAHFRRESPTSPGQDFELLPLRQGRGRFIGTVIGILPLGLHWWGEGEVKFYLDGDTEFPTIVGTGSEDYVGLAWCVQQTCFPMHGANLVTKGPVPNMAGPASMYRWHLADPVLWHTSARVSIQQIGVDITAPGSMREFQSYLECLRERQDDWSCCTFWYEPVPSAPLPALASLEQRLHALESGPAPEIPSA